MEEVFKVSVLDDKGNSLEAFVTAKNKDSYVRQMSSEYGPVTIEKVSADDLDEETRRELFGAE